MKGFKDKLSRRTFLKLTGVAAVTAAAGPYFQVGRAQGGSTLRILQWSHFVPSYDTWFDTRAKAWGQANDVAVTVDHINLADLVTTMSAEVSAGSGHDLIEFIAAGAGQFEPSVLDLTDINQEAESRFGKEFPIAKRYSYNPKTNKYYGFCHGWTIDPGDYRKSLWEKAGMPNGPVTWQDLITTGGKIKSEQGVQLGIGLSQELDSNMAARALLYSFDSALQDEQSMIVLDKGDTFTNAVAAVKYMMNLYKAAETPEVFAWNSASNNQALIAGRASFILNSISAYRSAQKDRPDIAKDVYFTPALKGPNGTGLSNCHVVYNYVIPTFAKNPDMAKKFILDLVADSDQAMYNSELYDSPSFPSVSVPSGSRGYPAVAGAKTVQDLSNAWFTNDPFKLDGEADGKLKAFMDAAQWTTNVGHPGPTSPAVAEVFNTFVIPNMMARAVRGQQSPEDSVKQAASDARKVFTSWRQRGLI